MRLGRTKPNYSKNNECYTPEFIFEQLNIKFDLDVCAPVGGIDWIPATNHFSIADDGLLCKWFGRVWMNPPYSEPKLWVQKWIAHANGIALLPISKSQWFQDLWDSEASGVPLTYRLKFIKPDNSKLSIFMPVMIWGIGEENIRAVKNANFGKVR